jgi:hypothetical protein
MRRIFVYFTSLLLSSFSSTLLVNSQDTILFPLKIKAGLEVLGPAMHYFNKNILTGDKNILTAEGYIAVDINEKTSVVLGAGYLNYKYSQYNFSYLNKGMFTRAGLDFNLLKPDKARGKYWAGIGLRYGLSFFSSEVPLFQHDNYWGTISSSISQKSYMAHFIEVSPGVRTEMFRNFSMGWSISLRMLVHSSTGKDLRPIYFPGFGNGSNLISGGMNYFLVWSIPYKKITVIQKKEEPEETEDTETINNSGTRPQQIRQ